MKFNKRFILAVVVAGGLALAACGGSSTTSDTEPGYGDGSLVSELSGPTTTLPAPEVMPLTGLPITDAAVSIRPALVAKIDNHPTARPQSGLNAADIVYEENVEQLTEQAFKKNWDDITFKKPEFHKLDTILKNPAPPHVPIA